jgi:hypothetical protein
MTKLTQIILFGGAWLLLPFLCASSKIGPLPADHEVQAFMQFMTGDFSSQAHHERDADFSDLRLHICPIWSNDTSNSWLYIERAPASTPDQPNQQLVYKVERNLGTGLKILVYLLPDPPKWYGGYKNPVLFDPLKSSDLLPQEGCTIYVSKRNDGSFTGGTRGKGCKVNLQGAANTASLFVIKPKMLRIWEQGFNEQGEQVWGGAKGGYEFVRQ